MKSTPSPSAPSEFAVLTANLIAEGRQYPAGSEVPRHLVPEHILRQHEKCAQPKRLVPRNYQGAQYADAQGNRIDDWDEHLAAQQEHLAAEQAALEKNVDEIEYYDPRPGQGSVEDLP